MTKVEFKDGTRFVVDSDKLRNFFIENGIPYKDYLEYFVRRKLGQKLGSYADFVTFKQNRTDNYEDKPEHLRLEMCGQRDGDGGIEENREIFALFNLPIKIFFKMNLESYKAELFLNE